MPLLDVQLKNLLSHIWIFTSLYYCLCFTEVFDVLFNDLFRYLKNNGVITQKLPCVLYLELFPVFSSSNFGLGFSPTYLIRMDLVVLLGKGYILNFILQVNNTQHNWLMIILSPQCFFFTYLSKMRQLELHVVKIGSFILFYLITHEGIFLNQNHAILSIMAL